MTGTAKAFAAIPGDQHDEMRLRLRAQGMDRERTAWNACPKYYDDGQWAALLSEFDRLEMEPAGLAGPCQDVGSGKDATD